MIRKLKPTDAIATATLHSDCLPEEFLPSFGKSFMYTLHVLLLSSPYCVGLGYFKKNDLVGFVIGTVSTKQAMLYVFQNGFWQLIPLVIKKMLTRPQIIQYLFQTITLGEKGDVPSELLVLAVNKAYRKKKRGTKLILELKKAFAKKHIATFKVGTHIINIAANALYQRMGGIYQYSTILYGKKWNIYYIPTI